MSGMSELIVSMWLLPVTLYIVLPLGMLAIWALARITNKITGAAPAFEGQKERADGQVTAYLLKAA